jgi:phage baseplate assembly protein W
MKAISYPFTLNVFGETTSTTDQRKIYTDRVLTLLSTTIGERPMRPTYGTNLALAMFENQGVAEVAIPAAIRSAIATWLPELTVNEINIKNFNDGGKVEVELLLTFPDYTTGTISVNSVTLNPDASTTRG